MENRIRIVWVLSLVSALVLIGVQFYWLYNQYQLVLNNYSADLADKIYKAGRNDHSRRNKKIKTSYTYVVNNDGENTSDNPYTTDSLKKYVFALKYDTIRTQKEEKQDINELISKAGFSHLARDLNQPPELSLSIDKGVSQDSLQLMIDMAVINFFVPFNVQQFDSLLVADIPGHDFHLSAWPANDTIYRSHWNRTGTIVNPGLKMCYAYSPFQKEGILIETSIPVEPLFAGMAVQLFIAFGLILILIGCLIFQIRTILKQKKVGEMRQNFVNTMIHELKRPVQTLKTFVSFLGDKEMRSDEALTGQVLQDSMFELDNLSAYLSKLKDMVRADNEDTPLNLVRFDLRELTDKVIRLIHIPAGKDVEFFKHFDLASPTIEADPVHLANVLSNLIENAIKYSGEKVNIEIKACKKGNELSLTVSDNGIGIPMVEQDRVFAKFYRGTNLPDNNIPGLGLGLSYVKLISEAHHGRVSLQSHLGEGTSVTLYLPQ